MYLQYRECPGSTATTTRVRIPSGGLNVVAVAASGRDVLTTADMTTQNLYKPRQNFARRPHWIFESIPPGFLGGRQLNVFGLPPPLIRNNLAEKGQISIGGPYGIWAILNKGRGYC